MADTKIQTAQDLVSIAAQILNVPDHVKSKLDALAGTMLKGVPGEPSKADFVAALAKIFLAKYPLLAGVPVSQLTGDLLAAAFQKALTSSGRPDLGVLTADATNWILTRFQNCGLPNANPPAGPPIGTNAAGAHIIRYFVEEVDGEPCLPVVTDSPLSSMELMRAAFLQWRDVIAIDFAQTGDQKDANLLITSSDSFDGVKKFDASTLALTDVGPPGGLKGDRPSQARMVFDKRKTFTRADFVATCAHELGHAIGISHNDVPSTMNVLMSPVLSSITAPLKADADAAKKKGWT